MDISSHRHFSPQPSQRPELASKYVYLNLRYQWGFNRIWPAPCTISYLTFHLVASIKHCGQCSTRETTPEVTLLCRQITSLLGWHVKWTWQLVLEVLEDGSSFVWIKSQREFIHKCHLYITLYQHRTGGFQHQGKPLKVGLVRKQMYFINLWTFIH